MRQERGAVLLVVLLATLALLGLGVAVLYYTTSNTRMAANLNMTAEARIVAEAGLEHARSILFSPHPDKPLTQLLSGSGDPSDNIPHDPNSCSGEARGAVLLKTVPYPSINRQTDLPPGLSSTVNPRMGSYTVYLRQDMADCRMGNYTCDYLLDEGECSPPDGSPPPNGYVVVTSVAVARDGRTTDTVEQTIRLRISALGTGGSAGGVGGTSQAGGSSGSSGGYGGSGGAAGSGTGGSGAGGSSSCTPVPCMLHAVNAVAPCPSSLPGCITINSNSLVDGYDSTQGSYGPGNQTDAGVGMRCAKSLSCACPNNCPSGCITGTVNYSVPYSYTTSTLTIPPYSPTTTYLNLPPDTTVSSPDPSKAAYYEELNLNGGTVTLRGGKYVVKRLNTVTASTIMIDDDDGAVLLWVLEFVSPNATVKVKSGRPSSFWLVYNGTNDVNNNSNNNFTGVIFAPAARVNLNYVVHGAVVGGQVVLNSLSRVHFDTSLSCP